MGRPGPPRVCTRVGEGQREAGVRWMEVGGGERRQQVLGLLRHTHTRYVGAGLLWHVSAAGTQTNRGTHIFCAQAAGSSVRTRPRSCCWSCIADSRPAPPPPPAPGNPSSPVAPAATPPPLVCSRSLRACLAAFSAAAAGAVESGCSRGRAGGGWAEGWCGWQECRPTGPSPAQHQRSWLTHLTPQPHPPGLSAKRTSSGWPAPGGKLPLRAWIAAAACSMLCSCTSAPLPLYNSVLGNLRGGQQGGGGRGREGQGGGCERAQRTQARKSRGKWAGTRQGGRHWPGGGEEVGAGRWAWHRSCSTTTHSRISSTAPKGRNMSPTSWRP